MKNVVNLPDTKNQTLKNFEFEEKLILNDKIESESVIHSYRISNDLNLIIEHNKDRV